MKPAYEPIILARKPGPMRELGIEECRIATERGRERQYDSEPQSGVTGSGERHIPFTSYHVRNDGWLASGRWPANLILECTCDETREGTVAASARMHRQEHSGGSGNCYDLGERPGERGHGDMGGKEPVRIHTDPNCPCAMLDGQTGTLKSGDLKPGHVQGTGRTSFIGEKHVITGTYGGDSGGASRFFFNVKGDPCDANTAERTFDLQSERAVSALSDAVTSASHGAIVSSDYRAPSMSVTPSAFARIITTVTTLTTSIAPECLPASLHISITAVDDPASLAETPSPTGTMTITLGRSKSGGSAEAATSIITQQSTEVGALDFDGQPRFRYVAKASRSERNAGCEGMEERTAHDDDWVSMNRLDQPCAGKRSPQGNHHPTVKPLALMRWLVKLVAQPGDVVLDPFAGSGTTGVACAEEGREFVGIEQDAEYIEIARRRIEAASAQGRLPVG